MAHITIRPSTIDDLDEIINMIQELADFEKMPGGPKLTKEILLRDGGFVEGKAETRPFFHSFVAEYDDPNSTTKKMLVGYTILYYCYSTWEGKSMFLEDLYIRPDYRQLGAGTLLYNNAVQFALENNCARLDFHVLKWNPARAFYVKMGATNLTEIEDWELFRMTQKDMERVIKNSKLSLLNK